MQRSVSTSRGIDVENQQQEVVVLIGGGGGGGFNNNPRRSRIDNEIDLGGDEQLPVTIQKVNSDVHRAFSWCKTPERMIHLIPVLIFVCFFILWWASSPTVTDAMDDSVVIKQVFLKERPQVESFNTTDMKPASIYATEAESFNTTITDLKPTPISVAGASSFTPNPSVSETLMTGGTTISADISPQQLVTGDD